MIFALPEGREALRLPLNASHLATIFMRLVEVRAHQPDTGCLRAKTTA